MHAFLPPCFRLPVDQVMFHYLKTWFVIDLVVVGTDWVFSLSENGGSAESSVKLLRSLRLFRMAGAEGGWKGGWRCETH